MIIVIVEAFVILGDCHLLDGLVRRGSLSGGRCLSPGPIGGLWGVLEPSPREFAKGISSGLLVACGSLSCVGCAAPDSGLGVWCQLSREPPSRWIATTRTSLLANKWTSVKNLVSICLYRGFILLFDWLSIGSSLHVGITTLSLSFALLSLHFCKVEPLA